MPSDKPNGVSCQVHFLANSLCKSGHCVTCVSFSPCPEKALYNHLRVTYKSKLKILRKFEPAFAFRKISFTKYDIYHYHGDDYCIIGNTRRIRTFYGSALYEALHSQTWQRRLYQGLFYFFELLSLLQRGYKSGISKATKKALPLIHSIVPCGVPLDIFHPGLEKTPNPSILFIGDLQSRKCGKGLVKIFMNSILKKCPDCILTIVGPEPCKGPNIQYKGNIDENNLVTEYQKAWVYVMFSTYEGFGVPVIEAMACGTAVIAINNPGVRSILRHNNNGLISDSNNFAADLNRVLSNQSLRNKLITNGLETVARNFDMEIIAAKYLQKYESIIHKVQT